MSKHENGQMIEGAMNKSDKAPMTLVQVREQLKGVKGKKYWRSVDELANTAEFQEAVEREFPSSAQEWVDPVSRRGFMKLMGASMALAGLAGCTKQPDEPIYPYVKAPEDLILGKPMYFATAHPFSTGAVPLLVKSDQFRPIKVDGNPEHPYNHGSSDPFTQGTLLDLYDPDRSQHVTYRGENREWAEFAQELRLKAVASKDGTGIYFLSSTISSPTLARQWKAVQSAYPKATLVQYDPAIAGTFLEDGPATQYNLADADVIVSLDADFLSGASYPGFHKLVGDYARIPTSSTGSTPLNRRPPPPASKPSTASACAPARFPPSPPNLPARWELRDSVLPAIPGPTSRRNFSPRWPKTSKPAAASPRSSPAFIRTNP